MIKPMVEMIRDYTEGKDDLFSLETRLFHWAELEGVYAYYDGLEHADCVSLSEALKHIPFEHNRCRAETRKGHRCRRYDGRVWNHIDFVRARMDGQKILCPYHRKQDALCCHPCGSGPIPVPPL
jgi:hypothetical protein